MSYDIAPSVCPKCLKLAFAATSADGATEKPRAGDVVVCGGCGAFLTFGFGLKLKPLADAEYDNLPRHQRRQMVRMARLVSARKGSH